MSDLQTRQQLGHLAEILHVEPARLAHLDRLDAEALRALRERISNSLFDQQAAMFSRVSRLAPLMPDALVAKMAQARVPPLVAGRAAGALAVDHPTRICGVLSRLSPEYMADCAPYLDPRTIAVIAPQLDAELLIPAANELLRRGEYSAAGRFMDVDAPIELIAALVAGIDDDAALLLTAAHAQTGARVATLIEVLPAARRRAVFATATRSPEHAIAALLILARLPADSARTLIAELSRDELAVITRHGEEAGADHEVAAVRAAHDA